MSRDLRADTRASRNRRVFVTFCYSTCYTRLLVTRVPRRWQRRNDAPREFVVKVVLCRAKIELIACFIYTIVYTWLYLQTRAWMRARSNALWTCVPMRTQTMEWLGRICNTAEQERGGDEDNGRGQEGVWSSAQERFSMMCTCCSQSLGN